MQGDVVETWSMPLLEVGLQALQPCPRFDPWPEHHPGRLSRGVLSEVLSLFFLCGRSLLGRRRRCSQNLV